MTSQHEVVRAFIDKLAEHGIALVDHDRLRLDGQIHRITVEGDRPRSNNLAYKIHMDEYPSAWFQDHKRGITASFRLTNGRASMTPEERQRAAAEWAEVKRRREAEQHRMYAERAAYCAKLLELGDMPAIGHPYIVRKGIAPQARVRRISRLSAGEFFNDAEDRRVLEDVLLVPVLDQQNRVASVQAILQDGQKFYCSGAQVSGCWHPVKGAKPGKVLVCEGYATGAALTAATGYSAACALSAGNLLAIAQYVRRAFPEREPLIMADNDHKTLSPPNPGLAKGRAAAEAIEARVLWPAFPTDAGGTDWDDWLRDGHGTADELAAMVEGQTQPEPPAEQAPAPIEGEVLPPAEPEQRQVVEVEDVLPADYTEDAIAGRWSSAYAEDFRFVAPWGKWMRWTGALWEEEKTLLVFDLVRHQCRRAAQAVQGDPSVADSQKRAVRHAMGRANTIASIERIARADRVHAATVEQWDADPMLLNTPAGVIDLRTGAVQRQRRDAYMTKSTNASPGGRCPTWLRFLEVATAGDKELQAYMQRLAGYSLTGVTTEQILVFVYGPGGNGKGTFINTLQWIMGSYAQTAPMDMFTERKHDAHKTELASLMGARLVCAQETEEGKRWAEARIKALTGGDKVRANFMRQDEFEFEPQFKLLFAGNHKPGMRNVDEAMRRRLRLVPFDVVIPAAQRDKGLMEKLRAEAGGILQWAIDGCLDWRMNGLQAPDRVLMATDEYLESQDQLGLWIKDSCVQGVDKWHGSRPLYESYRKWCEESGEYAVAQKRWGQQMEQRGFKTHKRHGVMVYQKIALRSSYSGEADPESTYGSDGGFS